LARAPEPKYAVISAGTNSCRLLIAVSRDGALRSEHHETRGTRLGENVNETHRLRPDAIERTLAVVRDYAAIARGADRVFGIGTSALRDAQNADEFVEQFAKAAGAPLEILSGEEEAASSFEGALCGLKAAGRQVPTPLTVVDVGGGSTEFATRVHESEDPRVASLQVGAVRITESFLKGDPPNATDIERSRQAIRAAFQDLPADVRPSGAVVAVGGTATTAGRMLQLLDERSEQGVCDIPAADLAELLKATLALPVRERVRLRGLPAQRADIFPAGLMILNETVRLAEAPLLTVCESDLLLGFIARHI
jgi:exopolyphosphatase / guanosine-5'-triphosphate,3'-diphosphate pyrophosphatase